MRFQIEKVAEEIKMRENAKIGFIEMDEERNVMYGIILNQSMEGRMDRNAKSMIEIIFKHDQFITVGVGKLSP